MRHRISRSEIQVHVYDSKIKTAWRPVNYRVGDPYHPHLSASSCSGLSDVTSRHGIAVGQIIMEHGILSNGLKWNYSADCDSVGFLALVEAEERDTIQSDDVSRCFDNPLFIPRVALEGEVGMINEKSDVFRDDGVVYLSTSKAAKLRRTLRSAGYKKVGLFSKIFIGVD
ncbi:hypothetical protein ACJJTC_009462 [Scirpophaga incertulas]